MAIEIPNKKIELTTKIEPVFRKTKWHAGFYIISAHFDVELGSDQANMLNLKNIDNYERRNLLLK